MCGQSMAPNLADRVALQTSGAPLYAHAACLAEARPDGDQANQAQALLAAIVESSDDAIISKTLEGVITSWNGGAERLFGYTASEMIGHSVLKIIPEKRRDEEAMILSRLRRGEQIDHYQTVRQAKDGRLIDISLTVSPIRDNTGRVVGASKVARDVSEMKDAQRRLEEADRRKTEFLALLAHELRNPLGPIRHAVKILRAKEPSPSELDWATSIIDRQAEHMSRLVEDLLDVSRITRGTIVLRSERVDLATVVKSAIEGATAAINKSGHQLVVTLPAEPIYVDGDPTRLAQILTNLIDNAVKYTERGGRIIVTAARDGQSAEIRVKDTGVGIAPELLPLIFDMFTQADLPSERSQGGLGVGLALVERLVKLHGGTVSARSEGLGMGSEFTIQLPLAVKAGTPLPRTEPSAAEQPSEGHCRALVVDDNEDSAESLALLLRTMGHDVRTAYNGADALSAAATFHPDIAIMDIGLPRMSGYEVAARLREEPWASNLVLVALTGWGQETHRRRSAESGFKHHLTKPVDLDVLQRILAETEHCLPAR
jgi:two-component system CheB/CheR fusion protein